MVLSSCAAPDSQASNEGQPGVFLDGQTTDEDASSPLGSGSARYDASDNGVVLRVTDAGDASRTNSKPDASANADAQPRPDATALPDGSARADAQPDVEIEAPPPCVRQCSGKDCGDDKCGGSCGQCETGQLCNASQQCVFQEITVRESGTLHADDEARYGPYHASARRVIIRMTGSGDADLYVRVGSQPTYYRNDCESDGRSSDETCSMNGPGSFYVLISGYASYSSYQLSVTYTPSQ